MKDLETVPASDLVPDPKNARVHTPRTIGSIVDSMHTAGVGRGIVIDENGVILAGNGAVEAAMEAFGEAAKVVIIDQDKAALTAVRRTGLTEGQKVRLALDDNRSAEHSTFDPAVLQELKAEHNLDLSAMWTPVEWDQTIAPKTEYVPPPTTVQRTHVDRRPELRVGALAIPLSAEEDAALDARLENWITRYGSTAGAGPALVEALVRAIEEDDAVKAVS